MITFPQGDVIDMSYIQNDWKFDKERLKSEFILERRSWSK